MARRSALAALALLGLCPCDQARAQHILLERPLPIPLGTPARPFGAVKAVVELVDGRLVVLGDETRSLALLERSGRQRGETVNLSALPYGIGGPVALASDGRGSILVIDQRVPRTAQFSARTSALIHVASRPSAIFAMHSGCSLGNLAIVSGLTEPVSESGLAHAVDQSGNIVRTVVSQTGAPLGFMGQLYQLRHLLCTPESRLIVSVSQYFATLEAHTVDGELRWSARLPDFRSLTIEHPNPSTLMPRLPDDGVWDQAVSIFAVTSAVLAVQVGRARGTRMKGYTSLRTFLVSKADGRVLHVQDDIPLVVGASSRSLFVVDAGDRRALSAINYSYRPRP